MNFREMLIRAKKWKREQSQNNKICEYLISHDLSLDSFSVNDNLYGDKHKRSIEWRSIRKSHLVVHSQCAFCGLKNVESLEVHHILPFCLYPELELDFSNLITLCEIGIDGCHLDFGHPLGTQSYNPYVLQQAAILNKDFSKLEEIMYLAREQAILI